MADPRHDPTAPTLPAPAPLPREVGPDAPASTSELERLRAEVVALRVELTTRSSTRGRIAEGVAVVTTLSVALAAVAHEVAVVVHDLTARSCP